MVSAKRVRLGALVGAAWLAAMASVAQAGPAASQFFYVPMPEGNIRTSLLAIYPSTGSTLNTVVSIVPSSDSTIIYYDHWEDGYEADIANPVQATTQVWGDNDPGNGIPPGFASDILDAGDVIALVNTMTIPRNPADIRYDARDRFASTLAIAASRASWATNPGTVLAGAVEIYDVSRYGTQFEVPVGTNVAAGDQLFEYTSLMIMADENSTTVNVDTDGDTVVDVTQLLNRGETMFVDGGVQAGATVTANKPVQAHILTGDIGSRYESRWFTLFPVNEWSQDYYTPVGSANASDATHIFLYNPNGGAITVDYETQSTTGAILVPAGGTTQFQMPQDSGAHFYTTNPGEIFYAIATIDSDSGNNLVHDWGFSLVPEAALTTQAVVGWGPGTEDLSANGSPVWVTAVADADVYIDYDGDPTTGPLTDGNGDNYDVLLTLNAFESVRVFDPDNDQTGMRLYTLDGTLITAAWGQDPDTAAPGNPFLDMGTTVLPLAIATVEKSATLINDVDLSGSITAGDILQYEVIVNNKGLSTLGAIVVQDAPPASTTYVLGSTLLDGSPVADDPVPPRTTEFPLDETGLLIPSIPPRSFRTITYSLELNTPQPPGLDCIYNEAVVGSSSSDPISADTCTPVESPAATDCSVTLVDVGSTPVFFYIENDTIYVRVDDNDHNYSAVALDTVEVEVTNQDNGDRETITLTETGVNTGIFEGSVPSSTTSGAALEDGTLNGSAGDTVEAEYTDDLFPSDVCNDTAPIVTPQVTKPLYLSDPGQGMDRIDPVAAGDVTTSNSVDLGTGSGTITTGSTSSAATAGTQTSLSFSHTVAAGSDRLLMVVVTTNAEAATGTAGIVNTVTYGGTPLTFVGGQTSGGAPTAGANARVEFWRLTAPAVGTANVVVNLVGGTGKEFAAGATNFTGVDQTTPLGTFSSANGVSTAASVTAAAAAGQVVLGGVSWDQTGGAITMGGGQTQLWQRNGTWNNGAVSTEAGAASVTTSYSAGASQDWAVAMVPIVPAPAGVTSTSFTQTDPLGADLDLPAGGVVSATLYVTESVGTLPNPADVTATIRYGATVVATMTNPTYLGGVLTFSTVLGGNTTIPAGQQVVLDVETNEAGVVFTVDYDSTTAPSQIGLPTTTAIAVESIEVYDAPYPGGNLLTGAFNGQTVYVRTLVSDPFGPSDITSVDLDISDPSPAVVISTTLTDTEAVATTASTKLYEYEWTTGVDTGTWTIDVTANEGTEGISDSSSLPFDVSPQDLGTPCAESFITFVGSNPTTVYAPGDNICVEVNDVDENADPLGIDTVDVTITGVSGDEEDLTLTETGNNTGLFRACIASDPVVVGLVQDGTLYAPAGEVLTSTYTDATEATDVCTHNASISTPAAAVVINKTLVDPAGGTAVAGDTVQFNLLVSNPGPTELSTVTVTDVFEYGCLTYDSASIAEDSVAVDVPGAGQSTITWNNVGPIASGGNLTIEVYFTAVGGGACAPTTNSSSVSGVDEFATPVSDGPDTADVTVVNPELTVTKTLTTADPVDPGDAVSFDITITNTGNVDIDTLPLTDNYSNFCLTFDSASVAPDGVGGGTIFWADLGPLAQVDPPITITVNFIAAAGCDPATNLALVDSATDTGGNPVPEAQDDATVVVNPIVDLSLTKTDLADPAGQGLDLTYELTVTNDGPNDATGVTVIDTLDANTTYVSDTASGGCVEAPVGTLTCDLGDIAQFGSVTFEITVNVDGAAPTAGTLQDDPCDGSEDICNTATVSANETELTPADNTDDEPTDVVTPVDLAITKTDNDDPVLQGGQLTYTVEVTNNGLGNATGVTVTDTLDPNTTYVSDTASGGCSVAVVGQTQVLTCDAGSVAAAGTVSFTVTVDVSPVAPLGGTLQSPPCDGATDDLCNTVSVTSTEPDTNTADNDADQPTDVVLGADLSITKVDGTDPVQVGASLTYTLQVDNAGADEATNVVVIDTLAAGTTYVSDTASGGCVEAPTGTLTCSLGDILSGANASFDITVTVDADAPSAGVGGTAPCTATQDLCNTATASSDIPDPDPSDNTVEEPTDVEAPASIGDRVWLDENGNGIQDAGEDGIAGVSVELYDVTGTILLDTAVTDTEGRYVFTNVPADDYVVRVDTASLPAGLAANPTFDEDGGGDSESTATVTAGQAYTTADFGFNWVSTTDSTTPALNATGAIGDRIWNDADGDGVQDPGEAGIAGVTVNLLTDDNNDGVYGGAGDNPATTVVTDAAGNYIFDGIAPGSYVVEVDDTTLPAGFTTTPTGDPDGDGDNTTNPIVLAPGDVYVNADFGYTNPGGSTIGDRIWLDIDGDGVQDPGEPGIPGVTVTLLDNGGNVIASTTTDAAGNYSFPGLADGTYTVVVTDTANVLDDTSENTGDPDGGGDRQATVVIAGSDDLTQDFGFAPINQDSSDGLIGDTIFLDRNGNGIANAGEGIAGVTVELYDATGTILLASVVTDANGNYVFGDLDPTATYVVRVDTATLPNAGAGLTNTVDPDAATASEAVVDLTGFANGRTLTQDFGYEATTPNTIGGTIWNDADADGTLEGTEAGRYAGVTVVLRDSDGNIVATTTTDASGNYSFTGIPDGTYTVDVTDTANVLGGLWHSDGPNDGVNNNSQDDPYTVTVAGGQTDNTGDFGYYGAPATLGDLVFEDANADGIQDPGEDGIAGATVTLTITYPSGDVVTVVTTTDAGGNYSFGNLLLDESFNGDGVGSEPSYSISVATPAGYDVTLLDQGGDDTVDADDPSGVAATPVQGASDTSYDFGFVPQVDLGITKDDVADPVTAGGSLVYSIVVENFSAAEATGVTVVDTLDANTTYVSDTASGGCVEAPAGTLTCDLGTLAGGATTSFTVSVSVSGAAPTLFGSDQTDPCDGSEDLCNTATVSADQTDPNAANDSDDEPTGVVVASANADLSLTKTDNETSVATGTALTYVLVASNAGPDASGVGVTLSDTLPGGLTVNGGAAGAVALAGADSGDWTCASDAGDPQTISCTSSASIVSGGSSTFEFTTDAIDASLAGQTLTNTATVSAPPGVADPDPSNDTDTDDTDVEPEADLAITKDDGTATYTAGGQLVYTITATNNGPNDVVGATVSDSFPPQLPNASWTCAASGAASCTASGSGDISESVDIPVGDSVVFTVTADVVDGATVNPLVNTASIAPPPGTTDPVPGNDSDDDQDTPTVAPGQLGDRVWLDENGDGVQDAGEDGIAGVTVQLYDQTGTILIAETVTGVDGGYIFKGVDPADYIVRVDTTTLPAGLVANPTFDEDGGADSESTATVVSGEFYDTADFGFNWVDPTDSSAPAAATTGSLGDRIWNDANGDGVQDPGESGIPGVTVRLLTDDNGDGIYGGAGDNPATTTSTDAAGNYIFDGIAPGAYVVEVDTTTLPVGYSTTPTGDPDGDGDSTSEPIVIAPGDVYVNADFGYTNPGGSTIGDRIWLDVDGDGVEDPGEPGIPGVTVTLLDGSGNVIATDITDDSGSYSFPGLSDGLYTVVVTDTANVLGDTSNNTGDPDGGGDSQSTVLVAGADELDQDFGYAPAGHDPGEGLIGDTIFLDRDSDGIADAGEGIEGVTVELYDSTGTILISTAVTDSNGNYVFGGLDPTATYIVQVDTASLPNAGAGLTNTVDPDGGADSEATVDLSTFAGGRTLTQDFAYEAAAPNTIEGTIWVDADADGTLDGAETTGLEGVTVVLRDSDGNVVATTTTDAAGDYSFEGIPDGTYTVDVTDDANVLAGYWHSDGPNDGADNNSQDDVYTVTVAGGVTDSTGDFGYYVEGASIGNLVFQDDDNDGIQDAGEPGIPGVEVTLTITYPNGDVVTVVTVTDTNGAYSFDNLLLDEDYNGDGLGAEPTYEVSAGTTPSGYQPSPINQGGDDQVDGDDHAGVSVQPVQGVTDTTDDALVTNGIDFGFAPEIDLELVKDDVFEPVAAGGVLTYTLTVNNLSAVDATGVTVVDTLDADTTYVSDTASGGCVEAPAGTLTCDLGTIAGSGAASFTVTVSVSGAAPTAGSLSTDPCDGTEDLCNNATVSADQPDSDPTNDSDDEPTNVTAPTGTSDMAITKTDGVVTTTYGSTLTYSLTVTNNGPAVATPGTSVVDTLPVGVTVNGGAAGAVTLGGPDAGSWSCSSNAGNPQTITCTKGNALTSGSSNTFTFTTDALDISLAGQTLTNTTTVTPPPGRVDNDPTNNTDTDDTTVAPEADLGITKDDGQTTYVAGGSLVYTITVTNAGPSDVTGASVTDSFPAQLINASWTCTPTGGAACANPNGTGDISELVDIPVGDTVVFTVSADILPGTTVDPLTNTASVAPPVGTTDPNPANDSDSDSDSPAPAPAAIGDRVWLDENGDGIQDAGEDGIAGVTVRLYDQTGTIVVATTTTDTDGRYIFTDVAPGDYIVRVGALSMPADLYANPTFDEDDGTTNPDAETAVTVAAGEFHDTADFGFNWVDPSDSTAPGAGTPGAIGDRIWIDADSDGIQDPGEAGLEGVTVSLLTDDNGDGIYGGAGDNPATTTTTDAAGNYIFTGLVPGAYVVEVDSSTLPAGVSTTPTGDPDGDGDNTSNPIVLAAGDVFVNADFGYPNPSGSTIGDRLFVDTNGDGIDDPGEPGLGGVTITLLNDSGDPIASTVTAADGSYSFPGLPDDTYTVVITDTANILDGLTPTADPDGGADRQSTVTLAGADDLDQDFGFTPDGHDPGEGLIGDTIFLDTDGSGSADPGEGLEGVTVELYDATGTTLLATAVTDAGGNYFFGGLDPNDTYVVRVDTATLPNAGADLTNTVDPDGGIASESTVDLSLVAGGVTLDQDFGYEAGTPGTIGGTIWVDANADGTLDGSETTGLEGVTVVLRDSDGDIVATTTTDANGDYSFDGIPAGTYTVDVTDDGNVLAGYWHSDGPNDGLDNNSQDDVYTVVLPAGGTDTTGDFGYYIDGAALGNLVFEDTNADGIQDIGELGVPGALVTLTITYPNGDVVVVTTVSDANGAYSFPNLLLDEQFNGDGVGAEPTYVISAAVTPTGYTASPIDQGFDDALDSDDHAGVAAQPVQGVTDTTNDGLVINSFDFGFVPEVDLEIVKDDDNEPVATGGSLTYTIQVNNLSADDATNVTVVDTLDADTTYVSDTAGCVEAPAGTLTCDLGTIAALGSSSFQVTVTVSGAAPTAGTLTDDPCDGSEDLCNIATVSADQNDPTPGNNTDDEPTDVNPPADLSITKTDNEVAVDVGTALTYELTVANAGPGASGTGVTVTDTLPVGITVNSGAAGAVALAGADAADWSCTSDGASPQVISCTTTASIVSGGTSVFSFTTDAVPLALAGTTVTNDVTVSPDPNVTDPVPGNNDDSDDTDINPAADLSISKTDSQVSVPVGTALTYVLTVANAGPSASGTGVTVSDTLPLNVTVNGGAAAAVALGGANSGDWSCTSNGAAPQVISCTTTASIASGGTSVFSFTTDAVPVSLAGTTVTNNTTVSPDPGVLDPIPGNNSGSDDTDIDPAADLSITKTDNVTDVDPGTALTYVLTVANAGPSASGTGVTVSDTLPVDVTVNGGLAGAVALGGVDAADWNCAANGASPQVISCTTTASIASGGTSVFNFTTDAVPVSLAETTVTNTAVVSPDPGVTDPVPGNNTDTDDTDINPVADLSIIKTDSQTSVPVGTALTYVLTVANAGPSASGTGVTVTDTLPVDVTVNGGAAGAVALGGANSGDWSCTANAANPQVISCTTTASIAASGSSVFSFTTDALDASLAGTTVTNAATVTPDPTVLDNNLGNNGDTDDTDVVNQADLAIVKSDLADPVGQNGSLTYELTVTNNGPGDATNVVVVDTLDSETSYVSDTASGGCVEAPVGTLTCDLGNLANGASTSFTITTTVSATAPTAGALSAGPCDGSEDLCNTATVSSDESDPNPADNTDDEPTDVPNTFVDLLIVKDDTIEPIFAGGVTTYQIAVLNLGPDDATDVVVTDTLDPNTTFLGSSIPCTETAGVVTCDVGAMALGDLFEFEISVYVDLAAPTAGVLAAGDCTGAEDVCNTVSVSSADNETNPANNEDTEPTDVIAATPTVIDLSVFKVDVADPVATDNTITYTIDVLNFSFDDAVDVYVTEYLDLDTTYVSDTAPGGCAVNAFNILECEVGNVLALDTVSFTVTVQPGAGASTGGVAGTDPCDGTEDVCNNVVVASRTQSDADPSGNAADEGTALITPQADLEITKTDSPDSVEVGAFLTYTLQVTNNGPSTAADVVVTDSLDANTTYISDTGGCSEFPVGTLTCSLGSLASGASTSFDVTVHVDGTAPTAGVLAVSPCDGSEDLCNNASVTSSTADPDPSDNTTDEPTNVVPAVTSADLALDKTDGTDPVNAGSTLTYTLAVTNAGPDAATGVTVVDTLPPFTSFVSDTAPGGCVEAPAGTLTCDVGAVAVGVTSFDITVLVDVAAPTDGAVSVDPCTGAEDLCNNAVVSGDQPDPDLTDNLDDEPTDVVAPSADVSVDKVDTADPVSLGGTLTYTITVTNAGPSTAANVVVVDTLDADTAYVSDTGGCVEAPAGTLTCALGDLAPGVTSFDVTVDVSAVASTAGVLSASPCDGSEDLCNNVTVSTDTADPNPANDSDDEPTDVTEAADLVITKVDGSDPVAQASFLTYTLQVTNNGPSTAVAVVVTDVLDADTSYISDTGGCVEAPAGTLTCAVGDLNSGASASFDVTVFVSGAAPTGGTLSTGDCDGSEDLCNTASVTSSTGDSDPSNNIDDEPTNVTVAAALADLVITKTDGGTVAAGAFNTYTLTVTNNGPDAATNVTVADTLDPNTSYFADSDTCVEAVPGELTCTLGDLAAGASVAFDVIVYVDPATPTAGAISGPACPGGEDLCNQATVASDVSDSDPFNNSVELATDVVPAVFNATIAVVKEDLTAEPVAPGASVDYQITVTNAGPDDAPNVTVIDDMGADLTYVSDTGGCSLGASARKLVCPLGTVFAGTSQSFQVTVTVAVDAPISNTQTDGDCAGLEDVCNSVAVASDASEVDISDNFDSEPTDVNPNVNCGDGIIDLGETCEPPAAEICNNGQDDDGDLLIDCADPDCAIPGFQSCDANCLLAPACLPILNDPAYIRTYSEEERAAGRRDAVSIHGRFIPETPADPATEGFEFLLTNANGEIYRARLLPGDFRAKVKATKSQWKFTDKTAKRGPGIRDGFFKVQVKRDIRGGFQNFTFKIKAYGDMSRAVLRSMTTLVYIGNDVAFLTAEWSGQPGRWKLYQSDYDISDLYPDLDGAP